MNTQLVEIFQNATNRFLNEDEETAIIAYANSLHERLKASKDIEKCEGEAIKETVQRVKTMYPNFDKFRDDTWTKCYRDLQLVTRACVHAMILNDLQYLDDKTLTWLQTIYSSVNFTPKFCRDVYVVFKECFQKNLDATSFQYIEPFLDLVIERLSSIPEPQTPMV